MGNVVGPPHTQNTSIYRVRTTVYMSTRRNLDSPSHPLSRQRVCPSPQNQRGGGTLACGWGVGGVPIPTTGEKLSTLPTLCPHTSGNSGARIKSGGRDGGQGHQEAAAVQGRSSFTPGWASHHHPSSRIYKNSPKFVTLRPENNLFLNVRNRFCLNRGKSLRQFEEIYEIAYWQKFCEYFAKLLQCPKRIKIVSKLQNVNQISRWYL
jgi:hypothetical protein